MATPKKTTPARKPATTRAQAFKALGITATEYKNLQYPRPDGDVTVLGPQIFASTAEPEANTVINWRGENFIVQTAPDGLFVGLPEHPAPEAAPQTIAEIPAHSHAVPQTNPVLGATQKYYIRNLHGSSLRVRTEEGKSHQLKPRGYRGDFSVLKPGDEQDSNVLANVEAGMVEILTHEQASATITKQHKNANSRQHLEAFLLNQQGKPMENGVVEATQEEVEGITVGHLNSEGNLGREGQKGRGMDWNSVREAPEAKEASSDPYAGMNEMERLAALDEAARGSRNSQNPLMDALGGLKVTGP